MNTHVDFDIAKLLKEKGFDEDCYRTYSNGKISPFPLLENMGNEPILNPLDYKWKNSLIHKSVISAPTIAETIMWLYEKHGIWISTSVIPFENNFMFEYSIVNIKECLHQYGTYDSPTEAYEAGIEHILNNLI